MLAGVEVSADFYKRILLIKAAVIYRVPHYIVDTSCIHQVLLSLSVPTVYNT